MDLSIIIPTLNECRYITETLDQINQRISGTLKTELILVDAGSTDSTVKSAEPLVDQIIVDPEFKALKYKSLNNGASIASGDILLFLDADSIVPDDFDLLITEKIRHSSAVGGAFEFKMDANGWIYRGIELINRIRYRIDRRYFGDQGVFCKKEVFQKLGGYPQKPIMEAAYFCSALSKQGKLALISANMVTSARRFREGNPIRVFAKDAWIWIQFTLGFSVEKYAVKYWKENEVRN